MHDTDAQSYQHDQLCFLINTIAHSDAFAERPLKRAEFAGSDNNLTGVSMCCGFLPPYLLLKG